MDRSQIAVKVELFSYSDKASGKDMTGSVLIILRSGREDTVHTNDIIDAKVRLAYANRLASSCGA